MNPFMNAIIWLIAAALLGFLTSALFSEYLRLSRRVFLFPYIIITGAFLFGYSYITRFDLKTILMHNWQFGVITGLVLSAYLVKTVFARPDSQQLKGMNLMLDIVWVGLAYGVMDALFLNVMPVLAVWHAAAADTAGGAGASGVFIAAIALVASLFITLAYHLGYSEFRNKSIALVLIGNALITLTFVVSSNPLGAIISHAAMHVAAVIRGPETALQLPPHRQPAGSSVIIEKPLN